MRNPKPRKWITWEIPHKYSLEPTSKEKQLLISKIKTEVQDAIEEMLNGVSISFKVTNLPKEY